MLRAGTKFRTCSHDVLPGPDIFREVVGLLLCCTCFSRVALSKETKAPVCLQGAFDSKVRGRPLRWTWRRVQTELNEEKKHKENIMATGLKEASTVGIEGRCAFNPVHIPVADRLEDTRRELKHVRPSPRCAPSPEPAQQHLPRGCGEPAGCNQVVVKEHDYCLSFPLL